MSIKRKKIFLFSALIIIVSVCIITSCSLYMRDCLSQKIVRLHVLANSNSELDQALKISVRDRILSEGRKIFSDTENAAECQKLLSQSLPLLEAAAADEIQKNGFDYPVKITNGNYYFPMKSYSSFALPAGNYDAVRVEIGAAEGENWWCVMFPPLCFVNGSAEEKALSTVLSPEEIEFISAEGGISVKFKIADFFEQSVNSIKTALKK